MIRFLLAPVAWFFRWMGMPLEGGQAIDLDDSGEWMVPGAPSCVQAIYLRPVAGAPSIAVLSANAIAGRGLEGDHHTKGGLRQVTILSKEAWSEVCERLHVKLPSQARRANLVIDKLPLKDSVGKTLRVGPVHILIKGETLPCRLMDEVQPGLKAALSDWNGGVYGEILNSGKIHFGDTCGWVTPEEPV